MALAVIPEGMINYVGLELKYLCIPSESSSVVLLDVSLELPKRP